MPLFSSITGPHPVISLIILHLQGQIIIPIIRLLLQAVPAVVLLIRVQEAAIAPQVQEAVTVFQVQAAAAAVQEVETSEGKTV